MIILFVMSKKSTIGIGFFTKGINCSIISILDSELDCITHNESQIIKYKN